jgi:hypothetical protein
MGKDDYRGSEQGLCAHWSLSDKNFAETLLNCYLTQFHPKKKIFDEGLNHKRKVSKEIQQKKKL